MTFSPRSPFSNVPSTNFVRIDSTKFRSGSVTPIGSQYVYSDDSQYGMFMGTNIKPYYRTIRSRFIWIALLILAVEALLFAWPITATAIWRLQAVLSWIWFIYGLKCLLLIWAIFSSGGMAFEKMWGTGHYSWTQFYRLYGTFRPSSSLFGWSTISFVCGAVLGLLTVIVSASLYSFYDSLTLYILSICIGTVSVIESFVAPFVLYGWGLSSPLISAKANQLKRNDMTLMSRQLHK